MSLTRLLTIPEAAEVLGVHRETIYSLIARGELAVTDLATGVTKGGGGKPKSRIREDVLAEFIDRRTRQAPSASSSGWLETLDAKRLRDGG